MIKAYLDLTKFGIVVFVLLTGAAGFALSYYPREGFAFTNVIVFLLGLYFLSSGSFALNEAQEVEIDAKMPRTKNRPLPKGVFKPWAVYVFSTLFITLGSFLLYMINPVTCYLGLSTVIMYNALYTMWWKKRWAFAAVPGAIPGAMPVLVGYSVSSAQFLEPEAIYVFLIMFLWQMPHFWCLAVRYKEDYALGSIPTLPVALGVPRTLFHMGLYTYIYIAIAIVSPWFVRAHVFYFILVLPFALKVLYEFLKYNKSQGEKGWLKFFLWVNGSMLVFVMVPVIDKWLYIFFK